jgi:hypothetical protein
LPLQAAVPPKIAVVAFVKSNEASSLLVVMVSLPSCRRSMACRLLSAELLVQVIERVDLSRALAESDRLSSAAIDRTDLQRFANVACSSLRSYQR